jgi:hypothetical protein
MSTRSSNPGDTGVPRGGLAGRAKQYFPGARGQQAARSDPERDFAHPIRVAGTMLVPARPAHASFRLRRHPTHRRGDGPVYRRSPADFRIVPGARHGYLFARGGRARPPRVPREGPRTRRAADRWAPRPPRSHRSGTRRPRRREPRGPHLRRWRARRHGHLLGRLGGTVNTLPAVAAIGEDLRITVEPVHWRPLDELIVELRQRTPNTKTGADDEVRA